MEWTEIRAELARFTAPYPHAAVAAALAGWDELAPRFLAELERIADGAAIDDGDAFDGTYIFALYLAAQKRDTRAYPLLLRLLACSPERSDEVFGDDQGTNPGRLLASVCNGDLAPLKALAENSGVAMWSRYAALHAMAVRVLEGDGSRDELVAYLGDFCEREAGIVRRGEWDYEAEPNDMLSWATDVIYRIGPAPLIDRIRGWFAEDLIDPSILGLALFEAAAAQDPEQHLADQFETDGGYIRDVLVETCGWAAFFARDATDRPWPDDHPFADDDLISGGTYRRESPKVGRNDPCPCGSGKKYKKCCGAAD